MKIKHHRALPESTLDNEQLVLLCRAGDQAAWNAVVDRYERLVYAIALREGLCDDQAIDVVQETFSALIEALDRLEQPERLGSWLMTVARRQAWRIRTEHRSGNVEVTDATCVVGDSTGSLTHSLWVYEAVEQLDDPCRSLVRALFFDPSEPSYGEVAVKLGRPLGSIGPLRGRCLERLRVILDSSR